MPVAALLPLDDEERRLLPGTVPLEDATVAIVESFADLPAGTWEKAQQLRWIVSLAAGADHVPFAKLPLQARVVSLHGAGAEPIAEHALALLLTALRRIPEQDRSLRAGAFEQRAVGRRVHGASLLVLGAGAIGSRIAALARSLGMRVSVWRRGEDLDGMLAQSEAVAIALPLTRETKGLLGAAQLGRMKPDAVLVNVARGKIVDREALAAHLGAHPDFVYATDVWWRYAQGESRFDEPLARRPNVIGTSHVAALVEGWRRERIAEAARVALALDATGEVPPDAHLERPERYDLR